MKNANLGGMEMRVLDRLKPGLHTWNKVRLLRSAATRFLEGRLGCIAPVARMRVVLVCSIFVRAFERDEGNMALAGRLRIDDAIIHMDYSRRVAATNVERVK